MFIETEEKANILVVDSDPALRNRLDELFNGRADASFSDNAENLTYQIYGGTDVESAIRQIEAKIQVGAAHKLIFVETQLVDGCGLQLISKVWQLDPDLHVVLCNTDVSLTWQKIVDIVGESDQLLILQKPFNELELRQVVHAMMRKWQLNKQSRNIMQYMELQIRQRTKDIEEANSSLLQSEKLASIGQLAAGIAHEINTPAQYVGDNIHTLKSFFDSLQRMIDFYRTALRQQNDADCLAHMQQQEAEEDLDFILEDAPAAIEQSLEGMAQIVRIVQAIKGFSHVASTTINNVNINVALENTLLVTRNSYKYIAEVETQFGELPSIECYPAELNQVFLNIIINAAHAIEDSGKGFGKIIITTLAREEGVEIRISDSGCGIPEALRDRIFDPFFTTKDVGRGSGQGLNIAYRIIHEQHQGQLSYTSELGIGTTFSIFLKHSLPKLALT